jgi:phosphatidylglycerol:prolipoprotein diacylglycerol transferase
MIFPEIDPVAFSLGPVVIRWYALAYIAGILLGWVYGLYLTRLNAPHRPTRIDIDDFLPWGVLGIIAGGRIGYVLFYQPGMILHDPLSLFKIWEGGMSFHGGATGVILALILYARHEAISLLRLSDIFCAACPIGIGLGRLANFINGELFGRVTTSPWGMVFPRGGDQPRHPSQLYEAFLEGLVIFVILFVLVHRQSIRARPGLITGVFLILYAGFRIVVEFFREPDFHLGLFLGAVSMGQILSVPLFILGAGVIFYALRQSHGHVAPR